MPLTYLSISWSALEMPSINCEINLILTWSEDSVISSADREKKFKTTDTKLNIPAVASLTQDNIKLLEQSNQVLKEQLTRINIKQKY